MHSWFGAYVGAFVRLLDAAGVESVRVPLRVCFSYSASRNALLPSARFLFQETLASTSVVCASPQGLLEGWATSLP